MAMIQSSQFILREWETTGRLKQEKYHLRYVLKRSLWPPCGEYSILCGWESKTERPGRRQAIVLVKGSWTRCAWLVMVAGAWQVGGQTADKLGIRSLTCAGEATLWM